MNGESPLADTLGAGLLVPVPRRGLVTYVDLDCAATTPVLTSVWQKVGECAQSYGSIHRGAGFKSLRSTQMFEDALRVIRDFVGGDDRDTVLLSTNTTTALNYLARQIRLPHSSTILYTDQEHSSNMLPWWKHWQKAIPAPSLPNGEPDFEKWEEILKSNDIALVACSAASNVTGYVSDVHSVARLAHRYGAKVVVDASQLAAHRKIERLEAGSPGHLDFVAFCGHKMYAPFGVGVLVGPTEMIRGEWPDSPGGGTVPLIEGRSIVWAEFPAREHSGTQNYLGVVALAEACAVLDKIGFETIADHEAALIQFGMERLANIPGVRMLRSTTDGSKASYLPIFPFAMEGVKSNLVGAYLGTEHGIGVRTGYLCQYDMVSKLLGLSMAERAAILISAKAGNLRPASGIVRASLGLSSTITDLSRLMDALVDFSDNGPCEQYTEDDDGSVKVVCK